MSLKPAEEIPAVPDPRVSELSVGRDDVPSYGRVLVAPPAMVAKAADLNVALCEWAEWVHKHACLAAAGKRSEHADPVLSDWRTYMSVRELGAIESLIAAGIWTPGEDAA